MQDRRGAQEDGPSGYLGAREGEEWSSQGLTKKPHRGHGIGRPASRERTSPSQRASKHL